MNPTTSDALTHVTVILALVLTLSFVIERILEVTKAAFDLIDSRYDLCRFWTRRARNTQQYIERRLRIFQYVDEQAAASLLSRFSEMMLGTKDGHSGTVPVLSGDLVRMVWIRTSLKFLGCAIGIAFAFAFSLDFLALSNATSAEHIPQPRVIGQVLTGIAAGLGSGVVHKVIRAMERKQKNRASRTPEAANA